jgi:hypothetical protein
LYSKVKELYYKATGKQEKAQLEKIYSTFRKVYQETQNSSIKAQNGTKYMISGLKAINELEDSKYKTDALNSYKEAENLKEQNATNEEIRQKTNWFQDKFGDWKFEFDDSGAKLKENIKIEKDKEYKIKDILDHKYLEKLYPEILNRKVIFKEDMDGLNGAYLPLTKTIYINSNLLKNSKNKVVATLLHEIQHSIQIKEKFHSGTSTFWGKERYYNSLGEIEADNTKQRFLNGMSKEERKLNIPESSKLNPKHSQYDKYSNSEKNAIDKFKDNLYNFTKGANLDVKENNLEDKTYNNKNIRNGTELKNSSFSLPTEENAKYSISNKETQKVNNNKYLVQSKDINLPFVDDITKEKNIINAIASDKKESLNKVENEQVSRHDIIQQNRELAKKELGNIFDIKDKSKGIFYKMNTMKRNLRDIMSPKQAKEMYNTYKK